MKMIHETLNRVSFAETVTFKNLSVTPLVLPPKGEPDYLTLDEALARGDVRVTETSEAGEVPELRLDNRAERPVLLIEGEELVDFAATLRKLYPKLFEVTRWMRSTSNRLLRPASDRTPERLLPPCPRQTSPRMKRWVRERTFA